MCLLYLRKKSLISRILQLISQSWTLKYRSKSLYIPELLQTQTSQRQSLQTCKKQTTSFCKHPWIFRICTSHKNWKKLQIKHFYSNFLFTSNTQCQPKPLENNKKSIHSSQSRNKALQEPKTRTLSNILINFLRSLNLPTSPVKI